MMDSRIPAFILLLLVSACVCVPETPSFIVLLADDMGYGDLYSYGHPSQEPNELDKMASEGMLFKNMYAADSICTPSRAALMTARIAARTGVLGQTATDTRYFTETDTGGMPLSEYTIAEALSDLGYSTGMVGKWHLGINNETGDDGHWLPGEHGFQYVGLNLPYSNLYYCDEDFVYEVDGPMPQKCFLYDGTQIIQQPFEHENITTRMVEQAKSYIESHKDEPFFLYVSFLETHTSLFSSKRFKGISRRGAYGDNVAEMAYNVGEILDHLQALGIAENTLVVFASDNGAHVEMCGDGGDTGMLYGGKANFWEGGIRIPAIAWMPESIPAASVSYELTSLMDLYPTFVEMAGGEMSADRIVDGRSQVDALFESGAGSHDYLFFHCWKNLFAVRGNTYKLVLRSHTPISRAELYDSCPYGVPQSSYFYLDGSYCEGDSIEIFDTPQLYNIDHDPRELFPLDTEEYGEIYAEFVAAIDTHMAQFNTAPSELGMSSCSVIPCCGGEPPCTCNYDSDRFTFYECVDED